MVILMFVDVLATVLIVCYVRKIILKVNKEYYAEKRYKEN